VLAGNFSMRARIVAKSSAHRCGAPAVAGRLVAAGVDRAVRAREKSSDHALRSSRQAARAAVMKAVAADLIREQRRVISEVVRVPHGRNTYLQPSFLIE
jgi:hypothetical protein